MLYLCLHCLYFNKVVNIRFIYLYVIITILFILLYFIGCKKLVKKKYGITI